jgi:hypothetical protein
MIVETDFMDHWKTKMLITLLDDDQAAPVTSCVYGRIVSKERLTASSRAI